MGKIDGIYKYWYLNGHLKVEQSYHKGKEHGRWTWWYENDRTLTFTDGVWSYNGKEYQAENDEELWNWWWYLNDNKQKEGHYLYGEKNGIWTWWYDSGIKQSEGSYVDDEMDGAWFYYNLDGSIAEEKGFAEGQLNGKTATWVTPEEKQSEKF